MHSRLQWNKQNVIETLKLPIFYMVAFLAFQEIAFHLFRMGFDGENLLLKLLLAFVYGGMLGMLCELFPRKGAYVASIIISSIFTIYYMAQLVYSGIFATYLSMSGTIQVATQALDFTDVIANEFAREWWKLIIQLLPLVCFIVWGRRKLNFTDKKMSRYVAYAITEVCIALITFMVMYAGSDELYSPYYIYKNYISVDMATEKLGVVQTLILDTKAGVKNALGYSDDVSFSIETDYADTDDEGAVSEDKLIGNYVIDAFATGYKLVSHAKGIDTSPNVIGVDLAALAEAAPNQNVRQLHEYIAGLTPTNKNEYTGRFEGYNVIFIVAEGFSGYVVDKNRTPMLYDMIHNGFYFKNYYTPLWYGSTLGGEYADLTGLMPKNGGYLSMQKAGSNKNDMCFTLSRQLERLGYVVNGYHANSYTYYDRQVSHRNLGLNWVGVGNGYEPEYSEYGVQLWPQSDERLVEETFDLYADEEHFYTYYLTVSGHVMYNFGGNAMAQRHKDMVEALEYSETTKAYIACQYELELALEKLVYKLEAKGIADNTLIVLTADHVPYNDKPVLDELAGYELDNTFEWYKNSLIIWSASMKEGVKVNKYCSSLDVLPTVSNLLGLEYDSRMMVGQDILSDSEGVVMFNDRSFITDRCSYNAATGEVKSIDGSNIDESYIEHMKVNISNKFNMAQSICDYDYYKYVNPWKED